MLIMSEKLDKMVDESSNKTFKSFSERIREGKNRVAEMLKESEDLQSRLENLGSSKEGD
jgi:hypothetical protein